MNTVNDIKNIIAEYSKKFRDISNDYNQDNALKTMKETISAFNSILNFEHVENTRIQRTRNTFNEELIFFIEQMCSDVLRLPNLEENINLVTSQREILIDKSDSGNGSGSGESTIVFNKVDEYVQKDMITIKGDTQVGKEKFTVMTAILHMFKGIIPVIITRNITGDATKLERGINNYFKLLENHMRENNKDIPFKLSCIRPHKLKPGIKTVPLVVCLGNSTQLKYIYDFIKETRKRAFTVNK